VAALASNSLKNSEINRKTNNPYKRIKKSRTSTLITESDRIIGKKPPISKFKSSLVKIDEDSMVIKVPFHSRTDLSKNNLSSSNNRLETEIFSLNKRNHILDVDNGGRTSFTFATMDPQVNMKNWSPKKKKLYINTLDLPGSHTVQRSRGAPPNTPNAPKDSKKRKMSTFKDFQNGGGQGTQNKFDKIVKPKADTVTDHTQAPKKIKASSRRKINSIDHSLIKDTLRLTLESQESRIVKEFLIDEPIAGPNDDQSYNFSTNKLKKSGHESPAMTDISFESIQSFKFTYDNIKRYLNNYRKEETLRRFICFKANTFDLAMAIDIVSETVSTISPFLLKF
jgi:hypothetical protein